MVCCNWDGGVLKEGLRLPCFGVWVVGVKDQFSNLRM